jgi:hypothetical protein
MPVPTPRPKKRLSGLPFVVLGSILVVVLVVTAQRTWTEMNPTCDRVLLRWEHPRSASEAEVAADRLRNAISIPETQEVQVDADLFHSSGLIFTWTSLYLVRVGTPDDLVEEAVHPYGDPGSTSVGSVPGAVPVDGTVPVAVPRTQVPRASGWTPAAIESGDVVKVGTGRESINEHVTLTPGAWYLAGDDISRVTVRACT